MSRSIFLWLGIIATMSGCRATVPENQDLASQPIPEPQLAPTEPPAPPQPFTMNQLRSLRGEFLWQGVGVSPASRTVTGERLVVELQIISADRATLSIDRMLDGVPMESGVDMRIIAAACAGCYDLVGEGEWGIVRVRIEGMPRLAGGPIDAQLAINFGGYADMPVEQIHYH